MQRPLPFAANLPIHVPYDARLKFWTLSTSAAPLTGWPINLRPEQLRWRSLRPRACMCCNPVGENTLGVIVPVRAARKARERALLEGFLRASGITAPIVEREAPDFLLQLPSGSVGIEVTQIHHPTSDVRRSPQARESAIARVVARAEQMHRARGGPSLRVSVGFLPNFDPQHLRRDATAAAIVELVDKLLLQPGEVLEWRPDFQTYKLYPEQLTFVHIYRQPPDFRPHWLAPQAGWVGPLSLEHLQARIDEKAKLLPTYRRAVPVVWLVFANEGRTPSQFFDRDLPFAVSAVRSDFDRTFLYEGFLGQVIELAIDA